jgi:HD-like signal output (HDOD) protein/ActR/RegA family two-component response regulator
MAIEPNAEYKYSILILDDDELVLESARAAFQKENYQITYYTKGEDALLFLKRKPVDIIISDVRMPGMSGIEFLNFAAHIAPEAVRMVMSRLEDKSIGMIAISKELAQHFMLKPWVDRKFRETIDDILVQRSDARAKELQFLLTTFTELPSAPKFHERLKALLEHDDKYLLQIIEEVEKNPALVAKLLRVSNSVYYGARKAINNVNDAIRFIGVEYVSSLVLAVETYYLVCIKSNEDLSGYIETLWTESIKRAELSKNIAMQWEAKCDPRVVYICSLLQDIGYVARMCEKPVLYKRYEGLCRANTGIDYAIETHIFTTTHDDVGAALLKSWNFPPIISSSIKKHHRVAGDDVVAQVLQVATVLMNRNDNVPHDMALDPIIDTFQRKLMEVPEQSRTRSTD